MLEFLAVGTAEKIATGVGLPVAGGLGLWMLQRIFSFKRVHAEIDLGGNGKKGDCPPAGAECPKHALFAQLQDDRHKTVTEGMARIEARMEKNFTAVFEKLNALTEHLLEDKG